MRSAALKNCTHVRYLEIKERRGWEGAQLTSGVGPLLVGRRRVAKAARLQRRGSPKFSRWNLRGQSVPGRSRGEARRQQVALNRKLTRRRGLQRRAGSGIPRLARRVGAGTSARPLRPQLTVRSRREVGESLESFPLAACSPPPGVPKGRRRLPAPGGAGCQPAGTRAALRGERRSIRPLRATPGRSAFQPSSPQSTALRCSRSRGWEPATHKEAFSLGPQGV